MSEIFHMGIRDMYVTDLTDRACACLKSVLRLSVDKDHRTSNWVLIFVNTLSQYANSHNIQFITIVLTGRRLEGAVPIMGFPTILVIEILKTRKSTRVPLNFP